MTDQEQVQEYLKKVREKQKKGMELLYSEKKALKLVEKGIPVTMRTIEQFQHYMD